MVAVPQSLFAADQQGLTAADDNPDRLVVLRQVDQQLECFAGDPVFAVVDIEVADGQRQLPAALGILSEEFAEVRVADLLVVAGERVPGRASLSCDGQRLHRKAAGDLPRRDRGQPTLA